MVLKLASERFCAAHWLKTWSLAMSGFGFMALVLESASQQLYNTHHEDWGGTQAENRTTTASAKSRGSSWSQKLLKSINNEILPSPWNFPYILDWAFCLTTFFEHQSSSPSSGRGWPAPFSLSGAQEGAGGGGTVCLLNWKVQCHSPLI